MFVQLQLGMELRVQYSLVQMMGETQLYNIQLLCNEGWNSVQRSFVMQLVQMRVEHSTVFICYATCAVISNLCKWGVKLGYKIPFVMQLCKWRWTCVNEGYRMEHSTIFICYATCADKVEPCSRTQGAISNYHGSQGFQANNWSWNAWVKVIQPTIIHVQWQPSFAGQ